MIKLTLNNNRIPKYTFFPLKVLKSENKILTEISAEDLE